MIKSFSDLYWNTLALLVMIVTTWSCGTNTGLLALQIGYR